MLVYGDDNGSCSLYDISLKEYNEKRNKIDEAENDEKDELVDTLWEELESHKIDIIAYEHGYVPDYVVELGRIYGFDVESN